MNEWSVFSIAELKPHNFLNTRSGDDLRYLPPANTFGKTVLETIGFDVLLEIHAFRVSVIFIILCIGKK